MQRVALCLVGIALAAASGGCMSSVPQSPPSGTPSGPSSAVSATGAIVVGGADSVRSIPGSPGALYTYRFKQIDPASDRFTFQDRDLSFYFRPTPTALFFQIENRQDRPVWIDWDRCTWIGSFGNASQLANAETRWPQRYAKLPPTQIAGLQRHSNYVFPIDYLVDPGFSDEQLHRPLFPEDKTAPQFVDREFGVTLMFRVEDRPAPYTFRFKVQSVLPR